jgi:hypothetical protein
MHVKQQQQQQQQPVLSTSSNVMVEFSQACSSYLLMAFVLQQPTYAGSCMH